MCAHLIDLHGANRHHQKKTSAMNVSHGEQQHLFSQESTSSGKVLRSRLAAPQFPIHQSASQANLMCPVMKTANLNMSSSEPRVWRGSKGAGVSLCPCQPPGAAGCSRYEFNTHAEDPLMLIVFISAALWSRRCCE